MRSMIHTSPEGLPANHRPVTQNQFAQIKDEWKKITKSLQKEGGEAPTRLRCVSLDADTFKQLTAMLGAPRSEFRA